MSLIQQGDNWDWVMLLIEPYLLQNNLIASAMKVGNQQKYAPTVNREFNIFLLCFNLALLITALFLMFYVSKKNESYPKYLCNLFIICLAPHIYVPIKLAELFGKNDDIRILHF